MSVLEELHYCIGLEFERNRETHTITMNQRSYIKEVLNLLNMNECKPVGTPFDVNLKLLELSDDEFGNVQRKMEGVPYKARVEISHVCNGRYEGRSCSCVKYGESIHIACHCITFDGCQTHHEVFKGHVGLQNMPRRQ